MYEYKDKVITCVDCGEEFIFTAGEQLFFADKGLKNDPKRCKGCKTKKNERIAANMASFGQPFPRERVEVLQDGQVLTFLGRRPRASALRARPCAARR